MPSKWAPFQSVLNTKSVLLEIQKKKEKKEKPILSSDELELLERNLLEAFHTGSPILVKYYYNGFFYQKSGTISHVSKTDFKIYFSDHTSLYFEQIMDLIFI